MEVKLKADKMMNKLFFNGEFESKRNIRGEDIYNFLNDLKVKMETRDFYEVG